MAAEGENLLEVETRMGLTYATHDGTALAGDLYLPKGKGPFPALIGIHGGGWVQGARGALAFWGQYLAARGIALFSVSYRLAKPGQKTYPQAIHDVLAGIQFVRGEAGGFNIDPERLGVFGHSAGGHLGALASLAGDKPPFANAYPDDPHSGQPTSVKVFAGVYGVYDLAAMWQTYNLQSPLSHNIESFMGVPLPKDRKAYFEATPISYATVENNKLAVHLSVGTEDDLVSRHAHTDAFTLALKQAGFYVRTVIIPGAPHYWGSDPIDEPGSYSGVLAPRLMRFLQEKL